MILLATIFPYVFATLGVLFLFGITVLIHEFGHFLAARFLGMRADAFAIGFGPAIWKRKIGDTEYRVNWIPFGGYVALPQLDPSSMDKLQSGASGEALPPAVWWKRIVVAVAGPLGNVVLAVVLALIVAVLPFDDSVPGFEHTAYATLGWVRPGSPAEAAGLRMGDLVISVGGRPVQTVDECVTECHLLSGSEDGLVTLAVSNRLDGAVREVTVAQRETSLGFFLPDGIEFASVLSAAEVVTNSPAATAGVQAGDLLHDVDGSLVFGYADFTNRVAQSAGAPLRLGLLRDGERVEVVAAAERDEESGRWLLGIALGIADRDTKQWMKYRNPWKQLKGDAGSIFRVLRGLFFPQHKGEAAKVAGALGGPVRIFEGIWRWLLVSIPVTIGFIRYLNVNLAILNLLPIPVLDGGHVLFALWEGITGRKPSEKVVEVIVKIFVALLLALFAFLTFKDTWALFLRDLVMKFVQ